MKVNLKKTTDKYIEILLETLEVEPQELGSDFVRWTAQRLAIYLEESTGIKLSGGQVRRTLKQKKYVYLLTNYSLESERNPEKITAFKIKIADEYLKIKKETPERLQAWFWDESGFSLRVTIRKNWCKKGSRKNVIGDRRKGIVNVMRGVKYSDKKRCVEFLNKGNSNNFYKLLKIFYRELINEWVEAGNQGSQFAEKIAKIVIVLDKASFHKKEEYLKKIETEMPNLNLEILPEYSPDYNLIESVWPSTKEYIANKLFKSIEKLEYLLQSLLNEGQLIIKWGRKIPNKGNACITV